MLIRSACGTRRAHRAARIATCVLASHLAWLTTTASGMLQEATAAASACMFRPKPCARHTARTATTTQRLTAATAGRSAKPCTAQLLLATSTGDACGTRRPAHAARTATLTSWTLVLSMSRSASLTRCVRSARTSASSSARFTTTRNSHAMPTLSANGTGSTACATGTATASLAWRRAMWRQRACGRTVHADSSARTFTRTRQSATTMLSVSGTTLASTDTALVTAKESRPVLFARLTPCADGTQSR